MRKILCLTVCLAVLLMCAGCAESENVSKRADGNAQTNVQSVLEEGMSDEPGMQDINEDEPGMQDINPDEPNDAPSTESTVSSDEDMIDLTAMSATMVYSEVFNMMREPESFLGKTVKMSGTYSVYHDESTGKDYHACIIQDATACCAQGIEFELAGDHVYPDDYPEEGGQICVTGTFSTYLEGGNTYCTLRNASIAIV